MSNPKELSAHLQPFAEIHPIAQPNSSSAAVWVDPASLPDYGDDLTSTTAGNVSDDIKRLTNNTFLAYGVGGEDAFGFTTGRAVKFVDIRVDRSVEQHGRLQATTIAEVLVNKNMLNGAGMLHGACAAYLIDNTPLVVLGLVQGTNGVGVTQSMNLMFHSPASTGTRLRIISTSITMGGRIMSAKCEIVSKDTGRMVASGWLSKMQPIVNKL
ncbi:hypothetical protein BDZ89DRAFT_1093664 [Hymenopellis radicata]|nr:hypothetical protein BDZ89DRAFT_1093664 [Hymenopellis radicata]